MDKEKTYKGSCFCGAIQFTVRRSRGRAASVASLSPAVRRI